MSTPDSPVAISGLVPTLMSAVLLTGHGGDDRYDYRNDVGVPTPGPLDVLVEVEAAGLNNTDVNVRTDWYLEEDTGLRFPRIQGADVAGRVVAVGTNVDPVRIGERVMVDPHIRTGAERRPDRAVSAGYLGFDADGGYAQYARVSAASAWRVPQHLPAVELAAYPVAYSTALEMLLRSRLRAGQTMLVTGASGGVGVALLQLGVLLGVEVIAVASLGKAARLRELGACLVLDRASTDLRDAAREVGVSSVDAVCDVVGGPGLARLAGLVIPGGTVVTAGGIAGPTTPLDLRDLIYRDLDLRGVSCPRISTFGMLVDLVAEGRVQAPVAGTFPLREFVTAQRRFTEKKHVGKIVITVAEDAA